MNKKLTEIMENGWQEWHSGLGSEFTPGKPTPAFEKGFKVACDALLPLLRSSMSSCSMSSTQFYAINEKISEVIGR